MADDSYSSQSEFSIDDDPELSDYEDDDTLLGQRAIASIKARSAVDKIESKKKLEKLRDVANAPSTDTARKYWHVLFKVFARETLEIHKRSE